MRYVFKSKGQSQLLNNKLKTYWIANFKSYSNFLHSPFNYWA